MLPETSLAETLETAERLRARLAAEPIIYAGVAIRVTASLGVTEFSDGDEDFQATLKRADAALYQAKELGRNRKISIPPNRSVAEVDVDAILHEARSTA
jgi:diguanylate cyclase (GGDEF)-like protein